MYLIKPLFIKECLETIYFDHVFHLPQPFPPNKRRENWASKHILETRSHHSEVSRRLPRQRRQMGKVRAKHCGRDKQTQRGDLVCLEKARGINEDADERAGIPIWHGTFLVRKQDLPVHKLPLSCIFSFLLLLSQWIPIVFAYNHNGYFLKLLYWSLIKLQNPLDESLRLQVCPPKPAVSWEGERTEIPHFLPWAGSILIIVEVQRDF